MSLEATDPDQDCPASDPCESPHVSVRESGRWDGDRSDMMGVDDVL